jgi:16S rRNA G527 N7-methylase RsmG
MEKKAKVVQDIVNRLGLKTMVYHSRAEKLLQEESFDTLVMRAVALSQGDFTMMRAVSPGR